MSTASAYKKMTMQRVFQLIQALRDVHSDMQIETAQLFVLIAMNPGITMRELQDLSGQRQAKVSRNVTIMSEWKTAEEPGLDLVVSEIDPHERRRKLVHLTPKGEELAERLAVLMS